MRRTLNACLVLGAMGVAFPLGGCFLAGPVHGEPEDAGSGVDATPPDAASRDAGTDGGVDAGPDDDAGAPLDAGPTDCPPGTVDLDGLPGCECTIAANPADVCNGVDDDCNPDTGDGSGDPLIGLGCDSSDSDLCEGMWVCNVGQLACTDDPTEDFLEVCGGGDEDCDGTVDEAGASDAILSYADSDDDGYGDPTVSQQSCSPPADHVLVAGDCNDSGPEINPGEDETCNGIDDDCDDDIDEEGCGCTSAVHDGHAYLFCSNTESWRDARDHCEALGSEPGYELVRIDDAAENTFVSTTAAARISGAAWIGLRETGGEGSWEWVFGPSGVPYLPWGPNEPSNSGFNEDCAEINHYGDGTWNDGNCNDEQVFVCEWSG